MVLDALLKIKNEQDPTLTFRRSCREGIVRLMLISIEKIKTNPELVKFVYVYTLKKVYLKKSSTQTKTSSFLLLILSNY